MRGNFVASFQNEPIIIIMSVYIIYIYCMGSLFRLDHAINLKLKYIFSIGNFMFDIR